MTESQQLGNNYGKYLSLPDFLGEQGKVYLGSLDSGKKIVIKYTIETENISPEVIQITQPTQKHKSVSSSEQTPSSSEKIHTNPITSRREPPRSEAKIYPKHSQILDCLKEKFNKNELRCLCFDLRIEWEDVEQDTPLNTAMQIILYCERRDNQDVAHEKLINAMKQRRSSTDIDRYFEIRYI